MISDEAKAFLRDVIRSVWALELLLLLRARRDRAWSVQSLARELRGSETVVQQTLPAFKTLGLIVDEGDSVRYEPDPRLDELVQEIANEFATHPFAVINEIVTSRESNVELFARAFRLRKDD